MPSYPPFSTTSIQPIPGARSTLINTDTHGSQQDVTAFVNSFGLPNQLFTNDTQQSSVSRAILAKDDAEENHELIEDGAINGTADDEIGGARIATANRSLQINTPTTDGEWNWLTFFILFQTIDREQQQKNNPVMKHIINP